MRRYLPFVLAALCLIAAGRALFESLRSFNAADLGNDGFSAWDARMRSVRAALPTDVRVIGYLEGADLAGSSSAPDLPEFFLTQYGLAPVILEQGANYEWIVGNFGHILQYRELQAVLDETLGRHTTENFGFGIYLIHRIPD